MNAFFQEFVQVGIYKRSQGRITRQVTCATIWLTIGLGVWRLQQTMVNSDAYLHYGVPALLLIVGVWLGYRVVNLPVFADFLIAVEAEMNKVSWPTRHELIRASLVVLLLILAFSFLLVIFDLTWIYLFKGLGVIGG